MYCGVQASCAAASPPAPAESASAASDAAALHKIVRVLPVTLSSRSCWLLRSDPGHPADPFEIAAQDGPFFRRAQRAAPLHEPDGIARAHIGRVVAPKENLRCADGVDEV